MVLVPVVALMANLTLAQTGAITPPRLALIEQPLQGSGGGMAPAPFDPFTMVLQVGTGAAGVVSFGLGGFFLGAGLANDRGHGYKALSFGVLGFFVGAHLGAAVGVWVGGWMRGNRGSFWATLGVGVLGTLLNALVVALDIPALTLLMTPVAIVGMLWTYHHTDTVARGLAANGPPRDERFLQALVPTQATASVASTIVPLLCASF